MSMPRRKQPRTGQKASAGNDDLAHSLSSSRAQEKPRRSGACVHCKSLKVRCVYNSGNSRCERCEASGIVCEERQRKKRKQAPTHEDLQQRALEQDIEVDNLMRELDNRAAEARVGRVLDHTKTDIARLAQCSPDFDNHWAPHVTAEDAVAATYAISRPSLAHRVPDIVKFCSLFPQDVVALFTVYFEKINPFFAVLDPALHTPQSLLWTSPFLFTVVCATAAKHFTAKPLRSAALAFALDLASTVMLDTSIVSVDTVQAFMILSVYTTPGKNVSDSRSSIFMGLAMRMALQLQLNMAPPVGCSEQDSVNRTRTWLTCICMDGAVAMRQGKPPTIGYDHTATLQSREWYRSSAYNLPYDVHMCAYVHFSLVMASFYTRIEEGSGQPGFDVALEASRAEVQLAREHEYWAGIYQDDYFDKSQAYAQSYEIIVYRGLSTGLIVTYLRLIVLAKGFQDSIKNSQYLDPTSEKLLHQSMDAAHSAINIMSQKLAPMPHFANATESNFLYASFCAAYLLKLLKPRFAGMLQLHERQDAVRAVETLTDVLCSQRGDLPVSYGHLLQRLLNNVSDVAESNWSSTATHYSEPPPSDYTSSGTSTGWRPSTGHSVPNFGGPDFTAAAAPPPTPYYAYPQTMYAPPDSSGMPSSSSNSGHHHMGQESLTDFQQPFYSRSTTSTPSSHGEWSDFGWDTAATSTGWSQTSAASSAAAMHGWK